MSTGIGEGINYVDIKERGVDKGLQFICNNIRSWYHKINSMILSRIPWTSLGYARHSSAQPYRIVWSVLTASILLETIKMGKEGGGGGYLPRCE